MRITFLGTGTSHGIPVLTCNCPVCQSEVMENKRTRTSVSIQSGQTTLIVDTTPEFRIQALREKIQKIDGVLYTHAHADHLHGIDDLRAYTTKNPIDIWGAPHVLREIEDRFAYIFTETLQKGGGKPDLKMNPLRKKTVIGDIKVTPIPIKHGIMDILGYRFNNTAYLTDCSYISSGSFKLLEGLDNLIIGALRYRPHSTHFNLEQALEAIDKIQPKKAYLTHICHDMEHFRLLKELPDNVYPAWDGLVIEEF